MSKTTKSTAKAAAKTAPKKAAAKTAAKTAAKKTEPVVTTERVAKLTPKAASNVNETVKAGLKTGQKPVDGAASKTKTDKTAKSKPATGGTRGGDQKYKVLSKENPFREGTGRHGAWKLLSKHTSTAAVRAESPLYGTAVFFRELEKRGLIKFV